VYKKKIPHYVSDLQGIFSRSSITIFWDRALIETFAKRSILFKFKEGENYNRMNTWVFRGLKFEPDVEIVQKGALCKGRL